jgi:hypothetical protein
MPDKELSCKGQRKESAGPDVRGREHGGHITAYEGAHVQIATHQSDLVNLSTLSHHDLEGLGDTVLAQALRELLDPVQEEGGVFARFDQG